VTPLCDNTHYSLITGQGFLSQSSQHRKTCEVIVYIAPFGCNRWMPNGDIKFSKPHWETFLPPDHKRIYLDYDKSIYSHFRRSSRFFIYVARTRQLERHRSFYAIVDYSEGELKSKKNPKSLVVFSTKIFFQINANPLNYVSKVTSTWLITSTKLHSADVLHDSIKFCRFVSFLYQKQCLLSFYSFTGYEQNSINLEKVQDYTNIEHYSYSTKNQAWFFTCLM